MRYTEARLTKFTQEVCLADLDKNVIDFGPNFDETEKRAGGSPGNAIAESPGKWSRRNCSWYGNQYPDAQSL